MYQIIKLGFMNYRIVRPYDDGSLSFYKIDKDGDWLPYGSHKHATRFFFLERAKKALLSRTTKKEYDVVFTHVTNASPE